ncbi:AAA family ATPase [Actinomadura yumaensis]|uniref:ATP-binding protein n=1 Tax=Actinomadura yumaensis TaxID=111807 RepID=UPI003612796E
MTRFVGRRRELTEAKQTLGRSRLVTLTGVGGVGKTRLAVRLASDLRRSFADGVWMVELSALREPELLPRTVADALQLPGQTAGAQLDRLSEHLSDKHLLLVLDTCEHLVDECALLSEVLLRAAPRLRILTTSREPLDVMGEHNLVIPPLPVPDGPTTPATAPPGPRARRAAATPSRCSPTAPRRWCPASRSPPATGRRWRGCAAASTASRSRSSWPPYGCAPCRSSG